MDQTTFERIKTQFNVLLVTTNDIEFNTVKKSLKDFNENVKSKNRYYDSVKHDTRYHFGKIEETRVALVKIPRAGAANHDGSANIIRNAVEELPALNVVFLLGVAATLNPKKAGIGSVVISDRVSLYEKVKVNQKVWKHYYFIDRSATYHPRFLYRRFDTVLSELKDSENPIVKTGHFVSGEKLVNSKSFAKLIKKHHPEALALEMEASGLVAVCEQSKDVDWMVIKGISDTASNKEGSKNQAEAMKNVMKVMNRILKEEELLKEFADHDVRLNSVQISGSHETPEAKEVSSEDVKKAERFVYDLTDRLVREGFRIVSGYGKTVGPPTVAGAYNTAIDLRKPIHKVLSVYPFPRFNPNPEGSTPTIKEENRQMMAAESAITVFVYGNKSKDGKFIKVADGVLDEFHKANRKDNILVPVGWSGYAAKEIWKKMSEKPEFYGLKDNLELKKRFDKLNDTTLSAEIIIDVIVDYIKHAQKSNLLW